MLDGDPAAAAVVRVGLGGSWNADFLTPTPAAGASRASGGLGASEPFEAEVARVRDTPDGLAREHLAVSLGGAAPPAVLREPGLGRRAADVLTWLWTHGVRPDWDRRRRVLEADVVARTARLGAGGWAAALDDLRPGMAWLGGGRLRINTRDLPPREVGGAARLLFVPVTPRRSWVAWETAPGAPHRYAVVYPCAGPLAGMERVAVPESLGALLGPARAAVLMWLESPLSTTHLVALTGQGLGSVGRHLRVLLDAGLVRRRRAGRAVLYYRTAAAETLLRAPHEV